MELRWYGWQGSKTEDQEQKELDSSDICQLSTDNLNYFPNINNYVHLQSPWRALWLSGWCSCKGRSLFQLPPWTSVVLFISHHSPSREECSGKHSVELGCLLDLKAKSFGNSWEKAIPELIPRGPLSTDCQPGFSPCNRIHIKLVGSKLWKKALSSTALNSDSLHFIHFNHVYWTSLWNTTLDTEVTNMDAPE